MTARICPKCGLAIKGKNRVIVRDRPWGRCRTCLREYIREASVRYREKLRKLGGGANLKVAVERNAKEIGDDAR